MTLEIQSERGALAFLYLHHCGNLIVLCAHKPVSTIKDNTGVEAFWWKQALRRRSVVGWKEERTQWHNPPTFYGKECDGASGLSQSFIFCKAHSATMKNSIECIQKFLN
jgi:hypothetical protein